ncbi:hypothetical protein JXA40_02360 [bacterium]|nr:hypothetical protein [candidate division CSSED10-310 bacterium]
MNRIFSAIFLLFIASEIHALDLPKSPTGFEWKKILDGKSALLVPEGWHFKHETQADTEAFFVTKEDISANGTFKTGLTLNVLKNIDGKTGASPSIYAMKLMSEIRSRKTVIRSSASNYGPFKTFLFRIRDPDHPETTIIHHVFAANDDTGTLWLFIFEAPEDHWDEEWKKGETMLNILPLETEI